MNSLTMTLIATLWGDTERICDDGTAPYDEYGRPNLACKIEGCGSSEPICWSYRLNDCYDESGGDNGTCSFASETCAGILACHAMWLTCYGEYQCNKTSFWGCKQGTCTEKTKTETTAMTLPPQIQGE